VRLIINWLYNTTGKSLFAAALFHATDPRVTGAITAFVSAAVITVWGRCEKIRRSVCFFY
jgi:hypothetical protein